MLQSPEPPAQLPVLLARSVLSQQRVPSPVLEQPELPPALPQLAVSLAAEWLLALQSPLRPLSLLGQPHMASTSGLKTER